jgi:hypothetical protein
MVPVMEKNGILYGYFGFDANENGGGLGEYLSIDTIELWVSSTPDATGYASGGLGTKIYDLDDPDLDGNVDDNVILLNYELAPGSGGSDMEFFFPVSLLADYALTDYLYLYSEVGQYTGTVYDTNMDISVNQWTEEAGDEEWARQPETSPGVQYYAGPIPEPGFVLSLFAFGMVFGLRRRRRV